MVNYVGQTIRIAQRSSKGRINDHVRVFKRNSDNGPKNWVACLKTGYQVGNGPLPPNLSANSWDILSLRLTDDRTWRTIDTVCQKVSYGVAMSRGRADAEKYGVVLYESQNGTTKIKWHPEGWEPKIG